MQVVFYDFEKRYNSTKQPGDGGTAYTNCELKENTNILTPTLRIKNFETVYYPVGFTYVHIPSFDRYYFVRTWRWALGVWECDCAVDVLASFKTEIGALSEYVLRSSYEFDGSVADSVYPATTDVVTHNDMLNEYYVRVMTAGFYVVGIIGKENTATQGAITYYQMTAEQMARLRAYLLSDTFLTDQGLQNLADFIPADATKVIYNPYQYIVSCQWFPFPLTAIPAAFKTEVSTITFGWWNSGTGFSAYRIAANAPVYDTYSDITITDHPQISRGSYLNHAPYTSRVLRFAPFGDIQIPDQYLETTDKIRIQLQVDFITGNAVLTLYALTSENVNKMMLCRTSQKIGVEIQLAQVGTDYYGAVSQYMSDTYADLSMVTDSVSKTIKTATTGDWLAAGLDSIGTGITIGAAETHNTYTTIGNYLKNKAPQVITSGHNGSLADYVQNNYLCNTFYTVVNEDNDQLGKPLCEIKTLSDIPGYIMVQNPDVPISCYHEEKTAISSFLASGFFYE